MLSNQDIKDLRLLGSFANYLIHRTRDLILANRLATAGDVYTFVLRQLEHNGMSGETQGYHGFTRPFCLSINENVLHGIQPDFIVFKETDVVRLDMVLREKHLLVDCAITFSPTLTDKLQTNLMVAKQALDVARTTLQSGMLNTVTGKSTQATILKSKKHVLPDFHGHSINPTMHAGETVPAFDDPRIPPTLYKPKHTYTIEPVVTSFQTGYWIDPKDGWSVYCHDKYAVHVEDTFLVNEDGYPENITKCHTL